MNEHHQNLCLEELAVTHNDATTLRALSDSGPISQAGLAALVHVQAQTMGKVLQKLEVKGLVALARATWDGRTVRTRITAEGTGVLRRVDQMTEASAESAGLSDEKLRTALINIIDTFETTPA
ncbi:MarR family winged helix-turn-helix transcriptional regulator [Arthrobacter sp. Hz1]